MHLKNNMLSGFSVRLSEDFAKIVCTNTIIPEVYKNCKLRQDLVLKGICFVGKQKTGLTDLLHEDNFTSSYTTPFGLVTQSSRVTVSV